MSLRTEETEIDGRRVSVTVFPGRESIRVWSRIMQLIGPAIGKAVGSLKGGSGLLDAEITPDALGDAVSELVNRLDEVEIEGLILRILKDTRIDGKEVSREVFDIEFAGSIVTALKIVRFVLETNYSDFWSVVGSNSEAGAPSTERDPARIASIK